MAKELSDEREARLRRIENARSLISIAIEFLQPIGEQGDEHAADACSTLDSALQEIGEIET